MSSISDPPPSVPTVTTPTHVVSDKLHHEVTVTGQELLGETRVTINDYMITTKTAAQNSKELLQDVEHQQAKLSADQGLQLALEASSYSRLINNLQNTYDSFSVDAAAFSVPTQDVNSTGTTLNADIANSSNVDAVTTYNQAVADFSTAQATFDASPQSQSDIDTYNAAVAAFNSAAASYNSATAGINSSISSYNLAVDAYNAQVTASLPDVIPPTEPRPMLTPASTLPTAPTIATFPPGGSSLPTTAALPAPVTADLVDYSGQSFGDVLDSSGLISAKNASKHFIDRTSDYQKYTLKDLTVKPQKQMKNITQPDAYTKPEEASPSGSGASAGTAALSSAATSPGEQKIQSVLTKTLIKQLLTNLSLPENLGVSQAAQAIAATSFTNTIQPAYDPNSPNESLLVSSLATLAGTVAQSQSGNIQATVTSFVQNSEEFKNLNEGDKKLLAQSLSAAVQIATLTLGAAGLANQLGGGSALGPALVPARIQANPNSAPEQFQQVQKAFDEAKDTFGSENVAATAGKLVSEELIKGGANSQTAFNIGTAVGSNLVNNGVGSSNQDLVALVQSSAQSANNGQALPDEQAIKLARALLLLGLGSAFQANAQGNLVQKIEPETANNLVEQATIRLFGFSANFSQATISRREDEPRQELSLTRELETQISAFRDAGDQQSLKTVSEQLDKFNKTVDDLGAFLTTQFMDPGKTFQGLMYGAKGTEFKRGQVDINE